VPNWKFIDALVNSFVLGKGAHIIP
jgi:hypothetical protein